jgi:CheY-like chemotaxis protein
MAKILVIDDNTTNRELLVRYLGRHNHEIITAPDGAVGLMQVWAQHPDLILLDLSMPVFDGWDTARQLKATPETRSIPIIAVTALTLGDTEQRARQAGCDDYVSKPVDLPGLVRKIDWWLGRRPTHKGPPPAGDSG